MNLVLEHVAIALQGKALIAPFSMAIAAGEIVTLMGPSGVGKSTLLQAIAGGLEAPFAMTGRVVLKGKDVTHLLPAQRRIGRLFQDDLLFPHLSVGENLLFGLARGPRAQRLARMRAALDDVELAGMENRAPDTLSGGQRQRVALMRCLLAGPDAVLLDEPFNKLDEGLRAAMRALTFAKLREAGTPALLVTHDRGDAPPAGRIYRIEGGALKHVR